MPNKTISEASLLYEFDRLKLCKCDNGSLCMDTEWIIKDFLIKAFKAGQTQTLEWVEKQDCDICGMENKMWNNRTESFEECPGLKHQLLKEKKP